MSQQLTAALARETIASLAPAARAFARAQTKGYVWIGEQGAFFTHEEHDTFRPAPPPNPNQLRLV